MPHYKDYTGKRFGRLVGINYSHSKIYSGTKHAIWNWKCDCGVTKAIECRVIKYGDVQSCGCLQSHLQSYLMSKNTGSSGTNYKGGGKRQAFKEFQFLLKGIGTCIDCGVQYHPCQLSFDHIPERGTKSFEIGNLNKSFTREEFFKELDKCDLVCHNCHSIRTLVRRKMK